MKTGLARGTSVATAALVASSMFLAGAHVSSARTAHAGLTTLRLDWLAGSKQLSNNIDPAQITSATGADIEQLVGTGLVQIMPNNKIGPNLADKWTVSKNRLVYTFHLRTNARFSNGDPVTAQDVLFSFKRFMAAATGSPVWNYAGDLIKGGDAYHAGKASSISGIKVINSHEIQFTAAKPVAYFMYSAIAYPTGFVLDPKVVSGKNATRVNNYITNTCAGNIGAGQFKFQCVNGSSDVTSYYGSGRTPTYTLVPNPRYWGKKAHVKIVIPAIPTSDTAYKDYLAGSLAYGPIPSADLPSARKRKDFHQGPTAIVDYWNPNTKSAPFSDVHCRLAMAYGVNRTAIMKIIQNRSHATYVVVPPKFLGYFNGAGVPHFDLAKAKSELSQCALKSTPVTYKYADSGTDSENEAAALAAQMQAVGFNWKNQTITVDDYYTYASEPLSQSNTQVLANGWQQDYPDPQDFISLLMRSDAPYNIGEWKSSKFDSLVDKADVTSNAKTRASLYIQAQKLELNAGAWVTEDYRVYHVLLRPNVHGLVFTTAYADAVPKNMDWSNVSVS